MFGFKKGYTKKAAKAFKSIESFLDIREIYDNGIRLKDNSIVCGIKLYPYDIWTCTNSMAIQKISDLRYALNQFDFPIYQFMVYSPSSFEELTASLENELNECSDIQKAIIIDDIEKLEQFSLQNKKVEFFLMIKSKNIRTLQKNYTILKTELSRGFMVEDCTYLDYLKYIDWLFDLDNNFLTTGYYKGRTLTDEQSMTEPEKVMSKKEAAEKIQDIDISIIDEPKDKEDYRYRLFDVQEYPEYFKMNDKYYNLILVKAMPPKFDVGILNYIGRNQNIKTLYITQKSILDLVKHVRKENKDLEEKLRSAEVTRNPVQEEEIKTKIRSLRDFANEMVRNRDKTLDVSLAIVVSHSEYKEMKYIKQKLSDEMRNIGFSMYSPKYLQLAIFKYMNPIFNKDNLLSNTLEFNIGFPISSSAMALTYPYHFSTNEDKNGFLYGYEMNMNGRILFNPFLYMDEEERAVAENRLTGNIILLGDSGSGKSTDLYLLYRYFIRRNCFIMWIDPENQNRRETINNGGTYLEFGSKKCMFNVFQLTRVSTDEENSANIGREMYDSQLAVINAIECFKNVLILYNSNISDNTLALVGMIAERMYQKAGFLDYEENDITIKAKYPTFENLKNTDFPTISDFAETVMEEKQAYEEIGESEIVKVLTDLLLKITPMTHEHKFLFDGHTTIDIELKPGNIIGIGNKRLYTMTPNVRDALQYIIYQQAFNYCLDDKIVSAFIYDEAHTTMNTKEIVSLLDQFTRRSRKYANINVLATQEPLDFTSKEQEAIFNQSTYIITKRLAKETSLSMLEKMIDIDERDINRVRHFTRGDSYFKCGSKSYYMHTLLTTKEAQSKGNNYQELSGHR